MENKVAYVVDDHKGGWFHISWESEAADDGVVMLSYWNPTEEKRQKLMHAMQSEDVQALCDLWDEEH